MLLAGGVAAWVRLPIDAFPDVTSTQVMILTQAPGLAAVDVEQRVSYPIEQVDARPAARDAGALAVEGGPVAGGHRLRGRRRHLLDAPGGLRAPGRRARAAAARTSSRSWARISTGLGEIFQYTLEGEGLDAMELRTIQDWLVAPLLKPIAGVNEVNSFGGQVKQYQVLVDPDKLLAYGLTVERRGRGHRAQQRQRRRRRRSCAAGSRSTCAASGLLRDIPDIERIVLDGRRTARRSTCATWPRSSSAPSRARAR